MTSSSIERISRFKGALLGLAVGDSVGTTLEFAAPGSFDPIEDMVGGGPFELAPGQWTDDTSMALCLAASLVETGKFDAKDQMERYCRWHRDGYMSSTGNCFDIGNTIRRALTAFEATGDPYSGPDEEYTAGNGSLMRLAPVALFFSRDPVAAIHYSGESSRTTHQHRAAVDACRYFGGLIVGALEGRSKEELLSPGFAFESGFWSRNHMVAEIEEVVAGSFKTNEPPAITGSGYVARTLEAALWGFSRSGSFREGLLNVVNLGEDADTTGAVYGQIAGAFYGVDRIPSDWIRKLHGSDMIQEMSEKLYTCSMA